MTTELNQLAEVLDGAVRGILSERETLPEVTEIANSYKTMLPTIASLCGIKVSDEEADSLSSTSEILAIADVLASATKTARPSHGLGRRRTRSIGSTGTGTNSIY